MKKIFEIIYLIAFIVCVTTLIYYPRPDQPSVGKIEVILDDGKIYLDIHLNSNLTCKETIELLDVKPEIINNKFYSPTCERVDEDLIRITYTEGIST
jgi:hypothetical protein